MKWCLATLYTQKRFLKAEIQAVEKGFRALGVKGRALESDMKHKVCNNVFNLGH